jgi:hypothetical protein
METVDREFHASAMEFIDRAVKAKKPFFVWYNATRMHVWTRLKKESQGRTGIGLYPDGMAEHDDMVGEVLKKIDDLGIADNTIVIYSTDNGAETFTWPDGGITPFHGEKGTTWEGGMRVPMVVRWPGVIKPGTVTTRSFPRKTGCRPCWPRQATRTCRKTEKRVPGQRKTFKVHADGYNFLPRFSRVRPKRAPAKPSFTSDQGGDLNAVRYDDWKVHFATTNGNIATGVREITGWPA